MNNIPPVSEFMTPFPHSIDVKDSVATALELMSKHGIRHLPVIAEGKPRSIISEREISHVLAIFAGEKIAEDLLVEDACAIEAYMTEVDTPLDEVLDILVKRHIGSVIVTKDGRLAGIFTSIDACRKFSEYLKLGAQGSNS